MITPSYTSPTTTRPRRHAFVYNCCAVFHRTSSAIRNTQNSRKPLDAKTEQILRLPSHFLRPTPLGYHTTIPKLRNNRRRSLVVSWPMFLELQKSVREPSPLRVTEHEQNYLPEMKDVRNFFTCQLKHFAMFNQLSSLTSSYFG
uniref:Uncharacterized protein n=1 Tax=Heterorhabditis bacteriophora TaxID=37862 RepID=A0A1I7XE07_HETBA